MLVFNDNIKYIVHEAQDDYSIRDEEKIVTMDPEAALKKVINGKKALSTNSSNLKNIKVELIHLDSIFRKPYDDEIQTIKEGATLLDRALEESMNNIKIGMKEYEIKAELDYAIMKMGFEYFVYPTVVLTGDRTSIPLGKTTNRRLENGDIIQIDVSPSYRGYELSLARVIFTEIDESTKALWKNYNKVFEFVSSYLKPGTNCNTIDSIVRNFIHELGFTYPHYTGYPLGGFTSPNIFPGSKDELERNSIFIFSPGLYIKGKLGFRIKRMIRIKDDYFETFDKFGE